MRLANLQQRLSRLLPDLPCWERLWRNPFQRTLSLPLQSQEGGALQERKNSEGEKRSSILRRGERRCSRDISYYYRHVSKGAWAFSSRDHGWPISDCSSEGLKVCCAGPGKTS